MNVNFESTILGKSPPRPVAMYTEADMPDMEDPIPAVYALWVGEELLYVGQSQHLRARLDAHRKDKTFTHCTFYHVPAIADRLRLEGAMILACRPALNKGLSLGVSPSKVWELAWVRHSRASGAVSRGVKGRRAAAKPPKARKKKKAQ